MRKEDLDAVWIYANSLWDTFKLPDTEEKYDIMSEVWYDLLKPYDLKIIRAGMLEHAKVSDFCNVVKIANQCQQLVDIGTGAKITEDDIVREIRKAISNGKYGSQQEFEKLSPIAKRIVGSPRTIFDWACMDLDEFNTVITSNIRRSARNQIEVQGKMQVIENQGLKELVAGVSNNHSLDNHMQKLIENDKRKAEKEKICKEIGIWEE